MEIKWVIRYYEEGDEEKIIDLYRAVHPEKDYDREKWMKWWRWMFKTNPAGAARILLADDAGKIAGQYVMVPAVVKIGIEEVLSAQGIDTMTHPEYRRQKLFETLAARVYADFEKEGISFLFGFPNELSRPGIIRKLNWFDIATMIIMLRPLNWETIISIKVSNRLLLRFLSFVANAFFNIDFYKPRVLLVGDGLAIKRVSYFDDRIDRLWTRISSRYPIMLVRNKEFLNWRYVDLGADYTIFTAEKGEEVVGYLVSGRRQRRNRQASIIYDLVAESDQINQCLLSEVIQDCIRAGDAFIEYKLIADNNYHKLLKKNGFLSIPFIEGTYFCGYTNSKQLSQSFIKNHRNWFVQVGDSDAI